MLYKFFFVTQKVVKIQKLMIHTLLLEYQIIYN